MSHCQKMNALFLGKFKILQRFRLRVLFFHSFSSSSSHTPRWNTHTIPNAYKLGGVLISLTHEASFLGHQLTEAGLGRDGAQEVSHCPAAEPAAWVLQSLPPSFHISYPLPPFLPFLSFHLSCSSLSNCILSVVVFSAFLSPLHRLIRSTAALCSYSITGQSNKETWTPLPDRSPWSVTCY